MKEKGKASGRRVGDKPQKGWSRRIVDCKEGSVVGNEVDCSLDGEDATIGEGTTDGCCGLHEANGVGFQEHVVAGSTCVDELTTAEHEKIHSVEKARGADRQRPPFSKEKARGVVATAVKSRFEDVVGVLSKLEAIVGELVDGHRAVSMNANESNLVRGGCGGADGRGGEQVGADKVGAVCRVRG